jgi:hypothetical protein
MVVFRDGNVKIDPLLAGMGRVGRPRTGRAKQLIAIRTDPRLLAELRRLAVRQRKPYRTLVHELHVAAVKRAA